MTPKTSSHIIKGMQKDTSKSKLSKEFAFDAKNIRITAREDGTLLSITNEKGNVEISSIRGNYLGHCVLNSQVVFFFQRKDENGSIFDYIALYSNYNEDDEKFDIEFLYDGSKKGNLNFNLNYPIEALGVYENEDIQKVYWVDGLNQPRVINIKASEEVKSNWKDTSFDFVPSLELKDEVVIYKDSAQNSSFHSGIIQYAFTYCNRYLQESNIFNVSDLCYISNIDRGGSPEEVITDLAFRCVLTKLDTSFEYVKIYSIFRTSLNATPTVKRVTQLSIPKDSGSIEFIDNGTIGEVIDPTILLYIGGEDIIANTITSKDRTLFLGNFKLNRTTPTLDSKEIGTYNISTLLRDTPDSNSINNSGNFYNSYYQNNVVNTTTFKCGEHYRLGVQFQHKTGKWSDPVFISDYTVDSFSRPNNRDGIYSVPYLKLTLDGDIVDYAKGLGYKRIRGVVVNPEFTDRKIIAQGMLCPTVFRPKDRDQGVPYAQSSWFIRPNFLVDPSNDFNKSKDIRSRYMGSSPIEFRHQRKLVGEISSYDKQLDTESIDYTIYGETKNRLSEEFRVDQSLLTFHSPDIEFTDINQDLLDNSSIKLKIVGLINFTASSGDLRIQVDNNTTMGTIMLENINIPTESSYANESLTSGYFYSYDRYGATGDGFEYDTYINAEVSPWQRSGSLAGASSEGEEIPPLNLRVKKLSNLKFSQFNTWFSKDNEIWYAHKGSKSNRNKNYENGISEIKLFHNNNAVELIKIKDISNNTYNYYGNVDTAIMDTSVPSVGQFVFYNYDNNYEGEKKEDEAILANSSIKNINPTIIRYKSSPHCVFKLNNTTNNYPVILPSLNGTNINNVKISSPEEEYKPKGIYINYFGSGLPSEEVTEASYGETYLQRKLPNIHNYEVNILWKFNGASWVEEILSPFQRDFVYYIKYDVYDGTQYDYYKVEHKGAWGLTLSFTETVENSKFPNNIYQGGIYHKNTITGKDTVVDFPFLYLAELYKEDEDISNPFGGETKEALNNNLWIPSSSPQLLELNKDGQISIDFIHGDTWYQRYDCLKTYAYSPEDINQVIEIASFMCETRVNMLGRYDKNIGNLSNLNADPTNFNLFNPVYSQKDNFFNYRILDSDMYKLNNFPNSITWSKEKHLGEDVDTWTNITIANTLDLDGTKGKVNKLVTFNEQIFAFQDKGISNILFNSRVQIPVSDGVPIEITNGYKVEGSRYISTELGCQNKYSIQVTSSGIYFLDSESGGIYLLGGEGLTNLSTNKGFDIWTKEVAYDPTFKTFYDKNNKDVYFVTKDYCLGYSEKLEQFTSFYDYNEVDTMFNVNSNFFTVKAPPHINSPFPLIWVQFKGEYNKIFGQERPYSITYIENDEPLIDKVFTNIEYRADAFNSENSYLPNESFDTIEVWNEYQKGKDRLKFEKYIPSNLKKKFRIWRANIPRDSYHRMDRMRNPWLFIKLSKENPKNERIELHDMTVQYFE